MSVLFSPTQLLEAHQERDALYLECLGLLHDISYQHPYYLRNLKAVKNALTMVHQYKATRLKDTRMKTAANS